MQSISIFAVLLLLSVCVSSDRIFPLEEYKNAFISWTQTHGKAYRADEFMRRFEIFQDNMDYVHEWNSQNHPTILGLTIFADLTNEEYQRLFLGTRFTFPATSIRHPIRSVEIMPSKDNVTVDWTTKGAVTPIKNQGQCGSCWSFSTTGSVEGINQISTGNLVSLSEQNLMDCSTKYGNEGCNGGLMSNAFQYIIDNGGIDTEASYPYKAVQGACSFTTANIGAKISGYKNITSGNETALQAATDKQPISVAIDASHITFQLYFRGVYNNHACSSINLDHGVLVVGYGVENGQQYWLVKNSWGTGWGLKGYINMCKNCNNQCGIATAASFPTV